MNTRWKMNTRWTWINPMKMFYFRGGVLIKWKKRRIVFWTISVSLHVCRTIHIRIDNLLAKRSVTKEKLASWLETVCCILDQHVVPWLEKAASLPKDISVLKNEKITDQERILTLQNQLIIQQQDQLKSV